MKHNATIDRYCGVDMFTVLNGLVGTIAMSIKAGGGDDSDVAEVFRSVADSYSERCNALREGTARLDV